MLTQPPVQSRLPLRPDQCHLRQIPRGRSGGFDSGDNRWRGQNRWRAEDPGRGHLAVESRAFLERFFARLESRDQCGIKLVIADNYERLKAFASKVVDHPVTLPGSLHSKCPSHIPARASVNLV